MMRVAVMAVGAALALGGCGDDDDPNAVDEPYDVYERSVDVGGSYVVDYCTYGALSVKQLERCLYHVAADDIEPLDTQAASYAATGQGPGGVGAQDCGSDAGPACGPGEKQDRALAKALALPPPSK
jgi:hypothetical protein